MSDHAVVDAAPSHAPRLALPMKLVDRLIWGELIGPFLNSVFMFVILLFSSAYLIKLTDLMAQGASFTLVMKVALYSLPLIITQTLPMGMLLGTLLAFGRLSGDSEHIALYATGISFYRICKPVAYMGALVALVAITWDETVAPKATAEMYRLQQSLIEDVKATTTPLQYTVKRKGTDEVAEVVIIQGGYDAKTKSLRNVTIFKMSDDPKHAGEPELAVYADRAQFRTADATDAVFLNGWFKDLRENPDSKNIVDSSFREARTLPRKMTLGRDFRGVMQAEITDNRRMTFSQLRDRIRLKRSQQDSSADGDEFDLWSKVSLPLASLIFGLVAAPLGIRPHRGSKTMGFGIAVSLIFCYWMVHNGIMYQLAKNGQFSPFGSAFTADLLGIVAAVGLMYRTRQ